MSHAIQIGKQIRTQREIPGITREELAEQIGISSRFCYDLEMGLKGMSVSTLSKLVDALGVCFLGNHLKIRDAPQVFL